MITFIADKKPATTGIDAGRKGFQYRIQFYPAQMGAAEIFGLSIPCSGVLISNLNLAIPAKKLGRIPK